MMIDQILFTRNTDTPTGGHTNILTHFELDRCIIGTNLLTKFHEDRTSNVASRVFSMKTAPHTRGHIGHKIFKLDRGIIGTKLLTKFHEDRSRNVASRVFTNKYGRTDGRTDDGQRPITKAHLSNQVS
ncbi:hypothetical protein DPMN_055430 [Dreissena polymorpha]|uniref:Uncharacterized protein n=1 Tax=Dreissena polymorpha TaxID=45954 RepID=A0A9D4HSA3_DREPO|nr:hypothetical protein DPMN_055430 [Dreissena polymorpha]